MGTRSAVKGIGRATGVQHVLPFGFWASLLLLWVLLPARIVGARTPSLELSVSPDPSLVQAGEPLTYILTVHNSQDIGALDVDISDTLPPGFTYIEGSTQITYNRTLVSTQDPDNANGTLHWSPLIVPAARSAGFYGMHTFIQDRCEGAYIGYQLDSVRQLMGDYAFAKQLFYRLTADTPGPESCWVDFVNACYDRELIPIVRLQGLYGGPNWIKPPASTPGDYSEIAQAYARVVAGLPRRGDRPLYVEIWNEPNLDIEWSGQANPIEYAEFLVDVAAALRGLGDPRIVILNGGLSPGGNYNNLAFIDAMATVPGALDAFDVWSAHPYPGNHPPEYNIHDDTAPLYPDLTIDSYLLELNRLAAHGRVNVPVLLTETGYALGQNNFGFQGYPPIDEGNRADNISRALRDYWSRWPEILGVCPFELVDPYGNWVVWDWLHPDGRSHQQYDAVRALEKAPPLAKGELVLRFRVRAAELPGTYHSQIQVTSSNAGSVSLGQAAPVQVVPSPPTATPTLVPTLGTPTLTPTPSPTPICYPVLHNAGFEEDDAWEIPDTAYPAGYDATVAHEGMRSMRVGIVEDAPVFSYSAVRQVFHVPPGASSSRISFWYHPLSVDASHGRQYALLLDADRQYLETVMWIASEADEWLRWEYEVLGHAGETLWIHFGVYNDGEGGPSAMYVDDVDVQVCGYEGRLTPTATPTIFTPTPSPQATASPTVTPEPSISPSTTPTASPYVTMTPSPSPTASPTIPTATPTATCEELLTNGNFETDGGWLIHETAYPARYTGENVHQGARSMALGIANGAENLFSYSSIEQVIDLPSWPYLELSFWYFPLSDDAEGDRQYLLLLDEESNYTTLMWIVSDARSWVHKRVDLSAHAGQRVALRFGVYNDGEAGVTALYLDDVSLQACETHPEMTPTQTPITTMTPTPTPTQTHTRIVPSATPDGEPKVPAYVAATIRVGRSPHGVAVDPATGLVYVANYLGGDLSIVDAHLGQVLGTIDLGDAAGCNGVALDTARSRAYVANGLSHDLAVVDLTSRTYLGSVPLPQGPLGVGVDGRDGSVYVSNYGSGSVSVIDGQFMTETLTITAGTGPAGLLVDRQRDRLVIANHHPTFNSLSLVSIQSGEEAIAVPVGAGPYGLALDSATGRIYSANTVGRSLSVVSADGTWFEDLPLPDEVYQVAYNGRSGHVFAVCPASQTVHVLDGVSGETLLTLPLGRGAGHGIALDEARQRVYITNADDDTLTIIQDTSGSRESWWLPLIWRAHLSSKQPGLRPRTQGVRPDSVSGIVVDSALPKRPPGLRALPMPSQGSQSNTIRFLALDKERRRLVLAIGDRIVALDAITGRPLFAHYLGELGGHKAPPAVALAVEPTSGEIYAAIPSRGELFVVGPDNTLRGRVDGLGRPADVAVGAGRVYVADTLGHRLVALDAMNHSIIATRRLPAAPYPIALDPRRHRVYVGQMGRGTILALNADTLDPVGEVALEGLGYPQGLALDALANRLYVAHALSPKYGAISAINTVDMTLSATLCGDRAQPLFGANDLSFDSGRGIIMLGIAEGVVILDAKGLAIQGYEEFHRSPWAGTMTVDALEATLYVAGKDGRLWIWQGFGEEYEHERR